MPDLPVHCVMAADIEQHDLLVGNHDRQGHAVGISQPDGMASGKFARKRVQPEAWLKRILLERFEDGSEAGLQIRVLFEEFSGLAEKLLRSGNSEHSSLSVRIERLQQFLGRGKPPHSPRLHILQ